MADYNNHFELTLDTLAPTGSITRPAEFIKENANLTITKGDASWMYVWRDAKAIGVAGDKPSTPVAAAETFMTDFSTSVQEHYHLVLEDSVGNQSEVYNTQMITFDNELPEVKNAYLEDKDSGSKIYTNEREVKYHFEVDDNLSGCVSARIAAKDGSIGSGISCTIVEGACDGTLTLLGEDGPKTVVMYVTDAAGNESVGVEATIELDTALEKPVLVLLTEAEASLPSFINYHDIKANLKSSETDIVAYKIWEDGQDEPAYITQTAGTVDYTKDVALSSGDGLKTLRAKIKDKAGTEIEADVKTVTIDSVDPVVSIERKADAAEWISNVAGFTTSTIHITVSDATAGVKSWVLKCNGTQVEAGNAAVDKDVTITSAIAGMDEGINNFTLEATDNAENTKEDGPAIVKLDTTAPASVSITALNTWYNEFKDVKSTGGNKLENITANQTDAGAGVATIYAWTSTTANDEECPAATTAKPRTSDAQVIPADDIHGSPAQSADNYMHIKVVDAVGNVAYAHTKFGFDSVVPVISTFAFEKDYYNDVNARVDMTYTDATSGVVEMKVTGTGITEQDTEWKPIAAFKNVTLKGSDGMKAAALVIRDAAGNESTVANAETELDRSKPVATIVLKNPNTAVAKDNPSNIADFDAWISFTDDERQVGGLEYKFYGPGIGKSEADVEWIKFAPEMGESYRIISDTVVGDDGEKVMTVKFRDAAGNESEPASASFELDTTEPEPEAKDIDYNRISKVHVLRREGAGTKYADETIFTLDPHCTMQAFKVCAYLTKEAAAAGSHEDAAIGNAAGSVNMSGTGLKSAAVVECKIKGADYEAALGIEGAHDGAHIVVVYVQDLGGNWSKAAEFKA